ncbi:MAG: TSUP family transporter [Casimicrobium sp.]
MDIEVIVVIAASLFAGAIDAIVGGGGLVLVPALFLCYPAAAPQALLGTNKLAAISGTAVSAVRFARSIPLEWRVLAPATGVALLGSFAGAWALTVIDPIWLRRALPFVLCALLAYTLAKKDFGGTNDPPKSFRVRLAIVSATALAVGFYDGLFGPGAGSFLIFLLVRFLRVDFLTASASAKVLNVASNGAAIALLATKGAMWWQVGAMLAVANVVGSLIGSRLALRYGSRFVKQIFVLVVFALICKTAASAYL